MTAPSRRPGLITLLTVFAIISGIFSIVGGIFLILSRNSQEVKDVNLAGFVLWGGIVAIAIGLAYLAVAKGLLNGRNLARLAVALISLILVIGGVWAAVSQGGRTGYPGWASAFWGIVLLLILYSPRANDFFAGR